MEQWDSSAEVCLFFEVAGRRVKACLVMPALLRMMTYRHNGTTSPTETHADLIMHNDVALCSCEQNY
jgi:hypothetical protein